MKHFFSDPELSFNKIVFEHRNKEYGAYDLRTEANAILAKSLFLSLAVIAGISLTAYIISPKAQNSTTIAEPEIKLTEVDFRDPIKHNVVVPPANVPPPAAPNVKTFNAQLVTPTNKADDSKYQINKPVDAVAGTVDNPDGNPIVDQKPQTNPIPNTQTQAIQGPAIVKAKDKGIVGTDGLSVPAKFDGGIDAFRNKILNKFDTEDFQNEEFISTIVTFVVEIDGSISNIKAEGKNTDFNKEAIKTVMEVKGKWSPGIDKDGDAVRSYFKFPIKMKFDQ